jgi:acyl phosphate:glycerol-3-phosphate acyltransferase
MANRYSCTVEIIACLITAVLAYFLGSLPCGYLVGRAKGVDIRKTGSGNIGATNAFRILGKTAGIIVLAGDGLKGWIAVALVAEFISRHFLAAAPAPDYLRIVAGITAILGHNYTYWLKFKGGKGIATSAGVMAALVPWAFVITLITWIIICLLTRYVSVASIAAALVLPVATWLTHNTLAMIIITVLMGALAIYKHKANIQRLMNGTENKVGRKKTPVATGEVS